MSEMTISPRIAALYELQAELSEPRMKELGIGWTSFQLLSAIQGAGAEASQAEVARRVGLTPATLSESVTAHVGKGWVQRVSSPTDKRLKLLALTPAAQKLMKQLMSHFTEVEGIMLTGVAAGSLDSGVKLLDRCIRNLEKELEKR